MLYVYRVLGSYEDFAICERMYCFAFLAVMVVVEILFTSAECDSVYENKSNLSERE